MSDQPDPCVMPLGANGRTALLLARAGNELAARAEESLAPAGVDARGYAILSILDSDGPGSQLELARLLGKAPALVVTAVDMLEDAGLVERTRDPDDRRRSRVTVTADGRKALAKADKLADDAVAGLLWGLDAAELAQLQDLLSRGLGLGQPAGAATA